MATRDSHWPPGNAAARSRKSRLRLGRHATRPARPVRGETARRRRDDRHHATCAARASASPRSRSSVYRGGKQDHRQGHHVLHAPARDDDEGRRAAAAGVRHRRARATATPRCAQADASTSRATSRPAPSLSQAFRKYPLYFDTPVLQPGRRRRAGRYPRRPARPPGDLQGKDPRDQGQDQVRAVLPDLRDRRSPSSSSAVIMICSWCRRSRTCSRASAPTCPAPTLMVMAISDFFVSWWYLIFGDHRPTFYFFMQAWRRSPRMQHGDGPRCCCKLPIFGAVIRKATIARWTRTLSTMFAAGVPLVESLDSVGGASGNARLPRRPRKKIQTGSVAPARASPTRCRTPTCSRTWCCRWPRSARNPARSTRMLGKVADFFEREVDDAVDRAVDRCWSR